MSSPSEEKGSLYSDSEIANWMKVLLLSAALVSFTLLAGNWVNAAFSIWSRSIPINFTRAELIAPGLYKIQLAAPIDYTRMFSHQIRLFDAAQDKFLHTPRTNSFRAIEPGLFTIEQKRVLLVAQPISPGALPSKGQGVLTFPWLFPSWISSCAFFLFFTCCAALFCNLPFPTRKLKVLASRFVTFVTGIFRMFGRHPLILLSLPSVYLLAIYPVLWKDVDALGQLISPANAGNIYHFPALFCFSARLVIWLGDCFSGWRWPDILAAQKPALSGIYTLVVAQHFALVLSLSLLCKTLTKREGLRGVFVLGFCLASSLYTTVQLCGSEAWSLCATIFLFAFGLRLYSVDGRASLNWLGYGFSLLLAIGSRHINLLLGFWLIGLYVAAAIRLLFGSKSGLPAHPLLKAGLAIFFLMVAVFSNEYLKLRLATEVGVEPRTTLGRTLSDRIDSFLIQIKPTERAALGQELAARTSDKNVALAVQDQATVGSFYKGTNLILEQQLRAKGFSGEHLQAEKDRLMLKADLRYLKTFHPTLLRVIWNDFLRGFTKTSNASLAKDPFLENSFVGRYRLEHPDDWTPLNELSATFYPESVIWADRSGTDTYVNGLIKPLKHSKLISLFFMTLFLICLCFWSRRGVWSRAIPALTIILTGEGIFAASMICVYFMQRYALPLWLSVFIALDLAIDGLMERCGHFKEPFIDRK